ncbi:abortive infection family protein [Rhizobium leguminosarum]|uniref:abortive infection family protein n=1 Tax=Rhizobium leguminosarum TaxID=384 RepID=UPI003F9DE1DA
MQRTSSVSYPAALVRALRTELASAISDYSANEVPNLCSRLGLLPGDREESFKSKFKYAERRLLDKSAAELIPVAARLLEEADSYSLSEARSKLDEHGKPMVSELTRKRVVAIFNSKVLTTDDDHMAFLRRTWPLDKMPSIFADRYPDRTLEEDLVQATVRNSDWDDRDILEYVGLLTCSQRQFFRFLQEVTSPLAQSPETQADLVAAINDHIRHDGFRLTIIRRMSGSPVYEVKAAALGSPADAAISQALAAYDADTIHARWTEALDRRDTNPEGAITIARTLLEDVCKWIIIEADDEYDEKDDLPQLYKRLAKILKLAPDDHTEIVFKQILGSCQSVVEALGSLRNKISDAHSRGPRRVRPAPRHAQLAVNLSGAMATFLIDTWNARKAEQPAAAD